MGFTPVDVGSLADGAVMEPGSEIYNEPMTPPEARRRLSTLD
jgi:predicted dinucleotide-binding enzyme